MTWDVEDRVNWEGLNWTNWTELTAAELKWEGLNWSIYTYIFIYIQYTYCVAPWEGRVCGPCEWRRHIGRGRGQALRTGREAPVSFGHRRRKDVNLSEMGGRQKEEEDDPFTAQSYPHAQSKLTCIAGKCRVKPLLMYMYITIWPCTYYSYCSRKINHLVSEPFAFILWCKKPCREHIYIYIVVRWSAQAEQLG